MLVEAASIGKVALIVALCLVAVAVFVARWMHDSHR
jgi:type II secretory pathway component PulK